MAPCPLQGPGALNDSPPNPGLNVRSGEGISPRLHAEVKQYLEHVERLFMDLALAEGCSRQCVTSLDLTWGEGAGESRGVERSGTFKPADVRGVSQLLA